MYIYVICIHIKLYIYMCIYIYVYMHRHTYITPGHDHPSTMGSQNPRMLPRPIPASRSERRRLPRLLGPSKARLERRMTWAKGRGCLFSWFLMCL